MSGKCKIYWGLWPFSALYGIGVKVRNLLLTRFFSHFHFFIEIASKSMSFPLAMNHGYTDV